MNQQQQYVQLVLTVPLDQHSHFCVNVAITKPIQANQVALFVMLVVTALTQV